MGSRNSTLNLDQFPNDIIIEISLHLDLKSTEILRLTSKRYDKLLKDNFWKIKCQRDFGVCEKNKKDRSWRYTYLYNYLPKITIKPMHDFDNSLNKWYILGTFNGFKVFSDSYAVPIRVYDPLHKILIYKKGKFSMVFHLHDRIIQRDFLSSKPLDDHLLLKLGILNAV